MPSIAQCVRVGHPQSDGLILIRILMENLENFEKSRIKNLNILEILNLEPNS